MLKITTFLVISALGLSACQTTTTTPAAAIVSEPTVMDPLIGKSLVGENITFIVNADGTMGGTARDLPVVGTYSANAAETCSTYSSPEFLAGREFCSIPIISGDTVVFNRRDGSQSQVYTITN
jgi:hypothetical protein